MNLLNIYKILLYPFGCCPTFEFNGRFILIIMLTLSWILARIRDVYVIQLLFK
jgi:hypothetical protein